MIGALIGDIVGSRFEFHTHKAKDIRFFHRRCKPTDDSIMSLAVAKAIVACDGDYAELSQVAVSCMQELGQAYPNAGYGGSFYEWLWESDPQPYHSYGNGAAMRVGPCGFAAQSLEEARELSRKVTQVSHDHPEGLKGAQALTDAVYLARTGATRQDLRAHVCEHYYDIDFTIDQIRPTYQFDVSCQGSVPVALEAFFESTSFEDAIRTAVSVGGDSDTIAAMAGAVAEAYYGVPQDFVLAADNYLDARQSQILASFERRFPSRALDAAGNPTTTVFQVLQGP